MSIDLKMAWRNIWRNARRTCLTVAAIAFACLLLVFMLSWQFGSYEAMIDSAVKVHTGHLQVQSQGYNDDKNMRLVIDHPTDVGKLLDGVPQVRHYTFRANAFSLVSSKQRTYGILVIGIDPAREANVSTLKSIIRQGSYLEKSDGDGALVGDLLAKNLQVKVGDGLTILGQGRDGSIAANVVTVKGIYDSGNDDFDRSAIHIGLANFQDTYSMMGAVHEAVAVCNTIWDVPPAMQQILAGVNAIKNRPKPLTALNWEQLLPGLLQGIEMDLVSGLIFYLILIIVVAFSILNTFLMAILERMREFGVMMAIGTTPGRLSRLVILESGILTLMGIVAGIILGVAVTYYFQVNGMEVGSSELLSQYGISGKMYPRLSLVSASVGPAAVLVVTFITALYPALKLLKLKPVEAMNYV